MKVEIMSDVMVPLGVTVANVASRAFDTKKGKVGIMAYQPIVAMVGTIGGYVGQVMSKKQETAKICNRLAVASFPAMGVAVYDWIREATAAPTGSRTGSRTVSVQADPLLQYRQGGI